MTTFETTFLKAMCQACLVWESKTIQPNRRTISIVTVAQAVLETGWGKYIPGGSATNNLGGIKHHILKWPGVTVQTHEVIDGKTVTIEDNFQTYPTIADYIADHASILLRWNCVRAALVKGVEATIISMGPWTHPKTPPDGTSDVELMRRGAPPNHSNYYTAPSYPIVFMSIVSECGFTDPHQVDVYAAF